MLYVVRHGKTDMNIKRRTMGCLDEWNNKTFNLCEEGIEESIILRDKLEDTNIDLIITSPLTRARETAYIINEKKDIEIIKENKLAERSMGNLEFRPYPTYEENERIWSIEENTNDYGIEPMQEFKDRIYNCMDRIVDEYQDKDILIVTHGGVTALIDCYFNNSLEEGSITTKFLNNSEYKTYDVSSFINKKRPGFKYKLGRS